MYRRLLMAYLATPKPQFWLNVNRTDGLADSDRVAIRVFHSAGLCASLDVMTYEEARAVVQIPTFYNVEGANLLRDWDWSALTGLSGAVVTNNFRDCVNLEFKRIGTIFGTRATILTYTFQNCANLQLTSLPAGFGAVATNLDHTFYGCTNLELTSLPDGFGAVATILNATFQNCANLQLTSLPDGFGAVATNLNSTFLNCPKLALTSLPDGFGAVATSMNRLFNDCSKLALTSLPDGFGAVATNLDHTFYGCANLQLTSLPDGFGAVATNFNSTFYGTNIGENGVFYLPQNFGKRGTTFAGCFNNTHLTRIEGVIYLDGITADIGGNQNLYTAFPAGNIMTHVIFGGDLKFTTSTAQARLKNIDNESLFSLVITLHDWWDESAGDFVGNENKFFRCSTLQKNTLDASDYESGYSYTDYITDKGWTITIQN